MADSWIAEGIKMADISLEDLLKKSPKDLKKKAINPFADTDKVATQAVNSSSPALVDALDALQHALDASPRSSPTQILGKETPNLECPTEEGDASKTLTALGQELAERRNSTRGLPLGLEKASPAPEQTDIELDDPMLVDPKMFEKRVPLFDQAGGKPPSDGTEIAHAPVDENLSLGGFNEERDTIDDVYRDKAGIKPKKYEPVDNSHLHGVDGERDTIADVIRDKTRYIPNQNDDDDDEFMERIEDVPKEKIKMQETRKVSPPEEIRAKNYATRSRSTFTGIGIIGKHDIGDVVECHDGFDYRIISISMTNNGVHLRRLDTGMKSRTSYEKFFGMKPTPFPYSKNDIVSYYNPETMQRENYEVVGLNPASNNVQLIIDGQKRFIRATKITLVEKAHDE
jgi:hypothetical protein